MIRCLLLAAALVSTAALPGAAQKSDANPGHDPSVFLGGPKYKKDKNATSRALKGTVTDDSGKPLEGALVTLTNTKSHSKLTFITKNDGRYNFDDLSFTVDYELMARYKNLQSDLKKISQYDHTPRVVRILSVTEPPAEQTAQTPAQPQQ